jgi:hypothetical protein
MTQWNSQNVDSGAFLKKKMGCEIDLKIIEKNGYFQV